MNKYCIFIVFCMFFCSIFAQNNNAERLLNSTAFDTYVITTLPNKTEINHLARYFSVDKVIKNNQTGDYLVRISLPQWQYADFVALNLDFEIETPTRPGPNMVATTLQDMSAWNKYPSYSVYTQLMEKFQEEHPDICKIDTILSNTPNHHAILVAHISNTLQRDTIKPSFFYSSTMHGDEVVGYFMMLRLIDYILNNYENDEKVQDILENVDLWICPIENPDGTYHSSDNNISSYYSSRYNANGIDLNRNYPGPTVENEVNLQPEIIAMMNFVRNKHFVMSANFHGGSQLVNYPWDTWDSYSRTHPDDAWFRYISNNYVTSCQSMSANYMTDEENGVTEGGDWYVITGSRQDYLNYYQHCREVTIEVSTSKVVTSTSALPTYWTNSKTALLNYILECKNGIHGLVTDAITGQPLEAKVWINDHDNDISYVQSYLPWGEYYRPLKAGTYTVTVSADCYQPQTFSVSTIDGQGLVYNIQLQPLAVVPQVSDETILEGNNATLIAISEGTVLWYDTEDATTPIAEGQTFITPPLTENTTYYVESVIADGDHSCHSTRASVVVTIENTTDITSCELDNYKIYPNPIDHICWIDIQQDCAEISIYDATGKMVFAQQSICGKTELNLEQLKSGVYWIKIKKNQRDIRYKLIKK